MVNDTNRQLEGKIGDCSTCINQGEEDQCPKEVGEVILRDSVGICEKYEINDSRLRLISFDSFYNVFYGPRADQVLIESLIS